MAGRGPYACSPRDRRDCRTMRGHFAGRPCARTTQGTDHGNAPPPHYGGVRRAPPEHGRLATVVRANPRDGIDFFPLTVDYREKTAAAGKFPGGFRKREGAPNEKEILTMRMIDRPIRPLFPDGFLDEVQIQVLRHEPRRRERHRRARRHRRLRRPGAISNIPFEGPTATVRVGRIHTDDGPQFVVNPTVSQMEYSDLDLVLAGPQGRHEHDRGRRRRDPDEDVLGAIEFGYEHIKEHPRLIGELVARLARPRSHGRAAPAHREITAKVKKLAEKDLTAARQIKGKKERNEKPSTPLKKVLDKHFAVKTDGTYGEAERPLKNRTRRRRPSALEKKITRRLIVEKGIRADGRKPDGDPPLEGAVGIFPARTARRFFQRGETQSSAPVTLGTGKDEQIIDGLLPEYSQEVHAPLQLPALLHRRGEAHQRPGSPRDRPRRARRAFSLLAHPAQPRGVPLHHPRRQRHHRVQRLLVDGLGLRRLPGAHGRRRAHQGDLRRHLRRPLRR
jgi:polyribonucleotide nucleotidyltransferase